MLKSAENILACLAGTPRKYCELLELSGLSRDGLSDGLSYLREKKVVLGIFPEDGSLRYSGAAVYYLPQDEDFAWIKYGKMHSQDTQRELDRENRVLKITAEKGLAKFDDFNGNGTRVEKRHVWKYVKDGLIQNMRIGKKPNCWKGPSKGDTYFYVVGMEERAAGKILEWLPKIESLTSGEMRSLSYFRRRLPMDIEWELGNRIWAARLNRPARG